MERILHFSFSTCMSLTDFTYTAWIWLLFFVFILCGGYCLVLHVSVSLVSALSTYFSTWSDRNEKSHFHSSFYVYYQSVFIWHFRTEIILHSTLLILIFTNISCVRHHCQTHSMNLADFPCFSFFFFFFLCATWVCRYVGYYLVLHDSVWLASELFIHFKLELIRMRRGTYFFILCSLSKCFHRRSGWKEYCIFYFFSLNSQTFYCSRLHCLIRDWFYYGLGTLIWWITGFAIFVLLSLYFMG